MSNMNTDEIILENLRRKMGNRVPMSKIRNLALNDVTGNATVAVVSPHQLSSFVTLVTLKTEEFANVFKEAGFIVEEDEVNNS
jgi:hypothetical protein